MVNLYSSMRNDPLTWVLAGQIALTFLVPWLNATMGIAIGLRHSNPLPMPGASAGSRSSHKRAFSRTARGYQSVER
jgi:hypothetical protein